MKQSKPVKKELLLVLGLTLFLSVGLYFLAENIDNTVTEITDLKNEVNELTRVARDREKQFEKYQFLEEFKESLEDNFSDTSEIILMLGQLEKISSVADTTISIKLEEGLIGDGQLEFKNETEKQEFLNQLNVKEFEEKETSSEQPANSASGNVALQVIEEQEQKGDEKTISINYLEIDIVLKGNYKNIRKFIKLMHNSKYLFGVEEMRINKTSNGLVEGLMKLRGFTLEKKK